MKLPHNITAGVMTMSQENYIAKLLEMEEAIIENVEKTDRFTYIKFIAARLRIAYTTIA